MQYYLFPELVENKTLNALDTFREKGDREDYYAAFHALLDFSARESVTGDPVREYLVQALLASSTAACCGDQSLSPYLEADCHALFEAFYQTDWEQVCKKYQLLPFPNVKVGERFSTEYRETVENMVRASSLGELSELIRDFFTRYADCQEARYDAFQWKNGRLSGIASPGKITFDQLGCLENQKLELINNTGAFLRGLPANDVLLVGSSGTGKSSSVKAVFHHFREEGLKLVELSKSEIASLPALMRTLSGKKHRYIVFIDDLSFEHADADYLGLKVVLDGQLEARPEHVLIYATSNRRHLIRETWKDRDADEDIHQNDTLHEKMSLSERFGIRLFFPVLSQQEYFAILELLLKEQGLPFTEETGREAAAWATAYNGRSGRTAKQFVAQYTAARK